LQFAPVLNPLLDMVEETFEVFDSNEVIKASAAFVASVQLLSGVSPLSKLLRKLECWVIFCL